MKICCRLIVVAVSLIALQSASAVTIHRSFRTREAGFGFGTGTAGVAYPVDARIDKAIDEAQTREDLIDPAIETAGWTKTSCPLLAGEGLDVAFPQVLDAAEEGESGKMLRQVNGQIVEDKANKVIARGDVLPVETAGLVDEDADFLCLFHSCAKGKMKTGISPRQQRRLLRLPVTPVLPFVGRYYGINSDLVQGGLAA